MKRHYDLLKKYERWNSLDMLLQANWVWPQQACSTNNKYIQFRHCFKLDSVNRNALLIVSCESNYAAYINGKFVMTGQFTDYPDKPTYSQVNVGQYLKKGRNVIAILGYHLGIEHFSHISTKAALMYCIYCGDNIITSGENTWYRYDGGYRSGDIERLTLQMGFVFEYDARRNDDWIDENYVRGDDWMQIAPSDIVDRPMPIGRPLPLLELKAPAPMNIIAQGIFKREARGRENTFADMMQKDFLLSRQAIDVFIDVQNGDRLQNQTVEIKSSVLKNNGVYLIIDLKAEECGFVSLNLEGPAGTIIDIAVGEHIEDKRVRANIGGRNFASRYICGRGRQQFVHYNNRYAGRFVELHVSPTADPVKINYAGIIPAEYPIPMAGKFHSLDLLMNQIYEVSRRTLHLCMHEHYEDCPWREQALYANDSRSQALTGYYAFGEYDFPRVSFDLLGRSVRSDNYLTLTAPSRAVKFTIPAFTMVWFVAMDDFLLFSGNRKFAENYLPQIQEMLDSFIESTIDNLLPCPRGKAYWHFYDWADGLEGIEGNGWKTIESIRFDAPFNLFFVMALQSATRIFKTLGKDKLAEKYNRQADITKSAVNEQFWVQSQRAYQTYLGQQGIDNHFCELVQSLAILTGTASEQKSELLREKLIDENNGMVATTLSQSLYKYEALCGDVKNYILWVFEDIRKIWGYMLDKGATSFWETIKGDADFDNAGSLCHGWSAIPIYFYQAYLLGVKPLENGFKKFNVTPIANILDEVEGTVMTPSGVIMVHLKKTKMKTKVTIEHPAKLQPVFDSANPELQWDIKTNDSKE